MMPFRALIALFCLALASATLGAPTVVDDCSDPSRWRIITSDGVTLRTSSEPGPHGSCLRLDFEFTTGAGYGIVERPMPLTLAEDFEIAFDIRGECPDNNLECKLLDIRAREGGGAADAENVWWVNRRAFHFPREWTRIAYKRRHFQFAWGPNPSPRIESVSKFQFAIAAAKGGKGSVWIDELTFREVPRPPTPLPEPVVTLSSTTDEITPPAKLLVTTNDAPWRPRDDDPAPTLTIDFGYEREFSGVRVVAAAPEPGWSVETSDDARSWSRPAWDGSGLPGSTTLAPGLAAMPDAQARYLRLRTRRSAHDAGADRPVLLCSLEILSLEFAATPNDLIRSLAKEHPAWYPRQFSDKQTYWTIVGLVGDDRESLIDELGRVEVDTGAFSLDPIVLIGDTASLWPDCTHTQSLADGDLPLPSVRRTGAGYTLDITPLMIGTPGASSLQVRYVLTNTSDHPIDGQFQVWARPFQVNPPWQFLNNPGGTAAVNAIRVRGGACFVDAGDRRWMLRSTPDTREIELAPFASTFAAARGLRLRGSAASDTEKTMGGGADTTCGGSLASLALAHELRALAPGESRTYIVEAMSDAERAQGHDAGAFDRSLKAAAGDWRARLSGFDVHLPPTATPIVDSLRAQLAYILINADGPAIQPGSRSYERSWIRDGCLTSSALLAFGFTDEARRFIDWYGEHLFDSGKVPCVVDARGPDPVPENDSHGEYIYAVANVYRYTHDAEFLRRHWARVLKAVAYMQSLREQRMTPEFADPNTPARRQEPGKPAISAHAMYGLLPESISHEGYSAKPMHSYWDQFFALRGFKDAAWLGEQLDVPEQVERLRALRDGFRASVADSLALTRRTHGIDYIPGCVELGDFDSTSTTTAIWPVGELEHLPREAVNATFDRYWRECEARRAPGSTWEAFTPYELRHVGALVRLGQRDRAALALDWYMQQQRPPAWRHWAEVVWHDPDTPKMIGDMPHTWCGSDFVNSLRAMLVYETEDEQTRPQALVLFAGVPQEWAIQRGGVSFANIRTAFGPLNASLTREGNTARVRLASPAQCRPPGGFVLDLPGDSPARELVVNAKRVELRPGEAITIHTLPAEVTVTY